MSTAALTDHLRWWGLRQFRTDAEYSGWQRQKIAPADLAALNRLVEERRQSDGADEAFYDLSARPDLAPVLYSQRYDYYLAVGPLIVERIAGAGPGRTILDYGCGIGVLTTFYARCYPDRAVIGVDRSAACVALAREKAAALGLTNIQFARTESPAIGVMEPAAVAIATHALLQNEQDLGIPSGTWKSLARPNPSPQQAAFEARTGLGIRLDWLLHRLASDGRLLLFEKTRALGRRIGFQRALAHRGLELLETPIPVCYAVVDEIEEDGPLYTVGSQIAGTGLRWDEAPDPPAGIALERPAGMDLHQWLADLVSTGVGAGGRGDPEMPLYENHSLAAQAVWEALPERVALKSQTFSEPDGRQMHVEYGQVHDLSFLYWANTFDQRQIALVERDRAGMLEHYYDELLQGDARQAGESRP